jgi:hypothetical protein
MAGMKYEKPELIDLAGLESFGACDSGSGDMTCSAVGNGASDCSIGNEPANTAFCTVGGIDISSP